MTESLGALLHRAQEWAKAQPKEVRLAIRQRALDAMLKQKLVSADGKYDPEAFKRFCNVEALNEMQSALAGPKE